ncbi:MAG: hypothetical protein ACYDH0_09040 [Candidatus Aminicenantales bacterium]
MSDLTYYCSVCGKKSVIKEGEPIPVCCHKEMEPLPYCTTAVSDPEQARNYREDAPCDDGMRAPKKK